MASSSSARRVNPAHILPADCTYQGVQRRLAQCDPASCQYVRIVREAIRKFPSQAAELLREVMPALDRGIEMDEISSLLERVTSFYGINAGQPSEMLLLHRGAAPASFAGDTLTVTDAELAGGLVQTNTQQKYRFLILGDVLASVADPLQFCAQLQRIASAGYLEIVRQGQALATKSAAPKLWDIFAAGNTLFFFERMVAQNEYAVTEKLAVFKPFSDQRTLSQWVAALAPTEVYQCLYWESGFSVEIHRKDGSTRSKRVTDGRLEELNIAVPTPVPEDAPPVAPEVNPVQKKDDVPRHRCLFLNTYYDPFLEASYRIHPELATLGYDDQLAFFQGCQFGDSDFYEKGLAAAGWEARTLIVNCPRLQQQWALEHRIRERGIWEIVTAQIEHYKPDVVYVQDMHFVPAAMVSSLTQRGIVVVGQNASDIRSLKPQPYSVLISSLPPYVEYFRSLGKKSYYQPLAFSESVLSPDSARPYEERSIPLSFVGGIADPAHSSRGQLLVALAQQLPVQVWGYGIDSVSPDSPIRSVYKGEAWDG